jgi:hypothetical protein
LFGLNVIGWCFLYLYVQTLQAQPMTTRQPAQVSRQPIGVTLTPAVVTALVKRGDVGKTIRMAARDGWKFVSATSINKHEFLRFERNGV